jgi:PAS domain S-box-containing protein
VANPVGAGEKSRAAAAGRGARPGDAHELRVSQGRWASAFESAGLGTWEIDLATRTAWRSQVHARIFGYEDAADAWSFDRFLAHVLPEEREAVRGSIEQAMGSGEPWTIKCRIRRRDGATRWLWIHGSPIASEAGTPARAFGLVQDVTEEEEAFEAVRDAERRQRQVLDAIPQLVWSCDPSGRCDYISCQWVLYTGVPASEQLGFGWLERLHPDERAATMEAWSRCVDTGALFDARFRIRAADGAYRWFRARAVPLRDAGGDVVKWFGTSTDVDDQIRAETALLEADRRKNEFLAVLSHELRNPLAPIKNSLFVLDHAAPGSERARRARTIIERQVVQLASLVDDLLDVTRITRNKIHLQRERLELGAVVRRTVEDHRSLFEGREVRVELAEWPRPLHVFADATRLAQVVGNLLQNAAKFTPAGGSARIAVAEEGAGAAVRVTDTGIGLRPETLERLFEPFVQGDTDLDRRRGGLGLGLALVKGLVELHGGTVAAESAGVGRGATFVVRLPLDRRAAGKPVEPATVAAARCRVLVVEDNRDAASSLRDALELAGHEVDVAADGREGIVKARALHPDLVLCDIGLPELDGYEVARALRADPATARLRLVAISGYALPDDVRRAREAGFDHHLAKPPDLARLRELLAETPDHSRPV